MFFCKSLYGNQMLLIVGAGQWASQHGEDGHIATPPATREDPPQTMDLMTRPPMDPDGGGDGEGDDDDFDDEEEDMEEEEDSGEESDDGEGEVVVLDPDHPLMKRFQKALKDHLEKQHEKVSLELRELLEATKNKRGDRENVGVELYGAQQELARHQMMLEKEHDKFSNTKQTRSQTEQQLGDVRNMYRNTQLGVNDERKKGKWTECQNWG